MVVPPPIAAPCTAATSGLSKSTNAFISRACGDSLAAGGFFKKSWMSLPAQKASPAPCQSTTRVRSSLAASLKTSASSMYMADVIAFFFAGRLSLTRRMPPARSVKISSIACLRYPELELRFDAARLRGGIGGSKGKCVAHFFLLGPQIGQCVRARHGFAGEPNHDVDAVPGQGGSFARVVRQQANALDAEIAQDGGRKVDVPAIGAQTEGMIGLDRIEPGVLQLVGLELCHQADAAALLVLVDHEPTAFLGDRLHRHLEVGVAIAAQRTEHFSGEALRMDAQQRNPSDRIAHDDCERALDPPGTVRHIALEADGVEHSPPGRHAGGRNAP